MWSLEDTLPHNRRLNQLKKSPNNVLLQSKKRLSVKCKGKDLPDSFNIDVTPLDIDDTVLVRDIVAPENVRIIDAGRVAVLGVVKAK